MTEQRLILTEPPVWRDDLSIQLGLSSRIILADPPVWQHEVLAALEHETTASELTHLARRHGCESDLPAFLDLIAPCIRAAAPQVRVALVGQGFDDEDLGAAETLSSIAGADFVIASVSPDITWVIARAVLVPQTTATLMAADRQHLPIVVGQSRIRVGPLIVPGQTACASCLALTASDRDGAWPRLAAQLIGRRVPVVTAAMWGEVARVALRLGSAPVIGEESTSVDLSGMSRQRETTHRPHAGCGCQFLAENETAAAANDPLRAPRTTTVFARRA